MSLESYHGMDYPTLAQLAEKPSKEFVQLSEQFPESFREHYGEVNPESYAKALQRGRDV